jgi:hypothetical protein
MDKELWDAHGSDGKLDPSKKHLLSQQKLRAIENVNRAASGDYGARNHIMLNERNFGSLVSQFRNWVAAYVRTRFGYTYIDQQGIVQTAAYKALINHAVFTVSNAVKSTREKGYEKVKKDSSGTTKQQMSDRELLGTIDYLKREAAGGRIKFKDMPKYHQQAVGRAIRELFAFSLYYGLPALARAFSDDDDDKQSAFEKILGPAFYWLWETSKARFSGDLTMAANSENWEYYMKTPIPAFGYALDLILLTEETTLIGIDAYKEFVLGDKKNPFSSLEETRIRYKNKGGIGKKGTLKVIPRAYSLAPFGSGVKNTVKFWNKYTGNDKKKSGDRK